LAVATEIRINKMCKLFKNLSYSIGIFADYLRKIINLFLDLLFFIQVLIYWPMVLIILKPLKWIDKRTNAGFFIFIDRFIRKLAG
jgi:hypothetical protein